VGTYVVLGPLDGADKATIFISEARNFAADKLPYMEFLRKGKSKKVEAPAAPVELPAVTEDRLPFSEVPLTPVPPVEAPPEVAPPVPDNPNLAAPKAEASAKPVVRRKRRPAPKAAAAAPADAPAKTATPKKTGDKLVGSYVSLALKNGNTAKGILVSKTATNYRVELPGLGEFDYAANTVKSITAAE